MKKRALFAALGLTLALTACAAEPGGPASSTPAPESTPPDASEPAAAGPVVEKAGARQAFSAALERVLRDRILPDGTDYSAGAELYPNTEENQFAVCDVDGDGAEELILLYNNIMMAGVRGFVYSWDEETGAVGVQLEGMPRLVFYESGAVESLAAHNQRMMSGTFWPYSIYRYDSYLDTYLDVGSVYAWSREALENGYPEEADKSGTGFVYYIATDGGDSDEPLDASVYQAWRYVYVRDSQEIQPEYLALTEENIQSILEG